MKNFLALAVCAALIGWAGHAAADSQCPGGGCQVETFYEEMIDQQVWFDEDNTSHTWTFKLNAGDMNPGDRILSADLVIIFLDDWDPDNPESAKVKVDGTNKHTIDILFPIEDEHNPYSFSYFFYQELTISDPLDHRLKVTVTRISGDFYVDQLLLGGTFIDGACPEPVPEPATMLLFGSGLAGLAVVGRRKLTK